MVNIKSEELLICFLLVIIGYIIAKIFSRNCECFNVGGQPNSQPNSQPNDCSEFYIEAESNCRNDPSDDLSQDCCDVILNPTDLNCNIQTINNILRQDIITAQNTCNTLFPPLDPHYDYNLISHLDDNTCLENPGKIKEFSDSCDVIPTETGETITDCNACRSAVDSYFDKCNNDNMYNIYNTALNNYC